MNKILLAKINRALENTKATCLAPVTKEALQARLTEELDWADADSARWALIQLFNDVMEKVRSAGIVTSPGYSFLTDSFLLYLTGVTRVNPVEWDLPFSRFLRSFDANNDLVLETGTGGIAVAEKVLRDRDEFILETTPGTFQITFLEGNMEKPVELTIIEYAELDRFKSTLKDGWHPLDEATLRLFGRGDTDGSIWFETDKMREWLSDFGPESMSDLVLLNALYYPGRIHLFNDVIANKQKPDQGLDYSDEEICRILRDSYGVPVYQEQSMLIAEHCEGREIPFKHELALKGHFIARTMLSVEALWHRRYHTSLK